MIRFSTTIILLATALMISFSELAHAASAPEPIVKFLNQNCVACHEGSAAEGGLDLTALPADLTDAGLLSKWMRIHDRVRDGEMPPADAHDLSTKQTDAFVAQMSDWLNSTQTTAWQDEGRVRGRRLTKLQLERTLHDLLGIDIPLAERMPEDMKSHGYTTVASGQSMSHFQLRQHLDVVDLALDEAFARAIAGDSTFEKPLDAKAISRRNPKRRTREPELIDNHAVTWSSRLIFYGRIPATTSREDGWYRFTIRAKSLNTPNDHGVWCTVRTGRCVSSAPLLSWVGAFEATDKTQEWTFDAWVPRGDMLEVRPGDDTLKMGRFAGGQVGTGEGGPQNLPGVAIEEIVMEKLYRGPDSEGIKQILFGDLDVKKSRNGRDAKLVSKQPKKDAESLLDRFAQRAFRRPVSKTDIAPFVQMVTQSIEEGTPLLDALRSGYRALLCSPRFVYFYEAPGELDDYAIASRLSYFLWNRMPDQQLLKLAEQNALRDPNVLRSQVDRMLASPHGASFVKDFADQWLDLDQIDFTTPDRRLYPGFDVIVQQSMVAETTTFVQTMLDENQSVTRLIDSKDGFLNERLARFYGIDKVSGDEMQPVVFRPEDNRGGLLTQGAILKVTANGTTTSPVLRGVWLSERLLGEHIPPPPTSVPAIEPDIRGATTIREMLEKHKSDPNCASCHRKIDPPGFALENFDPSGRWREKYITLGGGKKKKRLPIDASFETLDGKSFEGIDEFQKLIAADPDKLTHNVAEHLLTYGTGAPMTFADRRDLDQIVATAKNENYGLRTILKAVVTSPTFLMK